MKTTKLQKLARFAFRLERLNKIARTVRAINTNACNAELSKGSETRRENLENEAEEIAREFGLLIYCQRDPRGAALYLVDKSCGNNRDCGCEYTRGIALG